MRGERFYPCGSSEVRDGSSPHARGTLGSVTLRRHLHRFIPACAGNALRRFAVSRRPAVHPRMRGERGHCAEAACLDGGSSPHARGTQVSGRPDRMAMRFIPACAGNATNAAQLRLQRAVHPRMRGERLPPLPAAPGRTGSSPHARGTPTESSCSHPSSRFIPACAGTAIGFDFANFDLSVHPRRRGERLDRCADPYGVGGSSPHARGTHTVSLVGGVVRRFIPACAGNAIAARMC